MNRFNQSGFSIVAVVMILLTIGLLIMTSLNRQLSAQLKANSEERLYVKLSNRAASSLNWGLSQIWPQPQKEWRCQKNDVYGLSACVKTLVNSDNVLLKNGTTADNTEEIVWYYLASLHAASGDEELAEKRFNLKRLASGWLDFCPVNDSEC